MEKLDNKIEDIKVKATSFYTKYKGVILSFIILILIASFSIELFVHKSTTLEKIYQLERDKYRDSIVTLQDKTGEIVYKISERTVYEHSKAEKKTVDSLANILQIKEKEIARYQEIISETDFSKATGIIQEINVDVDSFHIYRYSYKDKFLEYDATASRDSLHYDKFIVRDSLYSIETKKTIGKKVYNDVVFKNLNPNVVITQSKSLSFEVPKEYSKFSLGAHIGINPITQQPVISVGLNIDILRFKKRIK